MKIYEVLCILFFSESGMSATPCSIRTLRHRRMREDRPGGRSPTPMASAESASSCFLKGSLDKETNISPCTRDVTVSLQHYAVLSQHDRSTDSRLRKDKKRDGLLSCSPKNGMACSTVLWRGYFSAYPHTEAASHNITSSSLLSLIIDPAITSRSLTPGRGQNTPLFTNL